MRLPQRILVCTDFSPCGDEAVAYALSLGARLDAEVVIAHLFDGFVVVQQELLRPPDPAEVEAQRQQGLAHLYELARRFAESGTRVRYVCQHGNARSDIPMIAEREGADLIILGRHGKGLIGGGFAGSVADSVLNNAHVPMLAVGDGMACADRVPAESAPARAPEPRQEQTS